MYSLTIKMTKFNRYRDNRDNRQVSTSLKDSQPAEHAGNVLGDTAYQHEHDFFRCFVGTTRVL